MLKTDNLNLKDDIKQDPLGAHNLRPTEPTLECSDSDLINEEDAWTVIGSYFSQNGLV